MEQITNELKKMVKAGMGAVATGMEKTQEAIETFAKKGEPIYQQAKSAVTDAADKVMQAVNDTVQAMNQSKPPVEEIIDTLRGMAQEDWAQVRAALDEFEAQAREAAEEARQAAQDAREAAQDILRYDAASDGAEDIPPVETPETPASEEEQPSGEPEE